VDDHIPPQSVPEQWDIEGLEGAFETEFGDKLAIQQWLEADDQLYEEQLKQKIVSNLAATYLEKCASVGDKMRLFEKQITLQILDAQWKDHLGTMDHLRQGIFLRSYGGKNPRQEYKREAFALFTELMISMQQEVIKVLSHVRIRQEDEADAIERQREQERARERVNYQHQAVSAMAGAAAEETAASAGPSGEARKQAAADPQTPFVRDLPKVGRNEPCPCGSGRKYKVCHGKIG
jgi:preprotein translocase subunit SecA